MLLSACGFALRGVTPMPFDTLYVGIPDTTQFGADVRRSLRAASPNTKLVNSPKEAQAILQQVNDARSLREVSLNAQGRVESYELGINFTFRLIDAKGNALIRTPRCRSTAKCRMTTRSCRPSKARSKRCTRPCNATWCRACCAA